MNIKSNVDYAREHNLKGYRKVYKDKNQTKNFCNYVKYFRKYMELKNKYLKLKLGNNYEELRNLYEIVSTEKRLEGIYDFPNLYHYSIKEVSNLYNELLKEILLLLPELNYSEVYFNGELHTHSCKTLTQFFKDHNSYDFNPRECNKVVINNKEFEVFGYENCKEAFDELIGKGDKK